MDSSSDESFAWEKASSGGSDSDNESPKVNGDVENGKTKIYDKNSETTDSQISSPKKKVSAELTAESTPNNVEKQSKSKPGRLLDRICFDPDSDEEQISHDSEESSSCLKRYLYQNRDLQPILKGINSASGITDDDEIWILKCPRDVNIEMLHSTDFTLDSKSKIKINGETFCGNLDENGSKITIMSSIKNNFIIKNVLATGTIHFRKRLPKPFVQEDNVMVNNQTDYIPLPETKSRHPLFGPNYKDAINVHVRRASADSAAAELDMYVAQEKKKKKKHKKEHKIKPEKEMDVDDSLETSIKIENVKKHKKDRKIKPEKEIDVDDSLEISLKIENDSDVSLKKPKKRKHTSNDESFKKKSKRIKLEPDSAEAWESEKAIEENLFNF